MTRTEYLLQQATLRRIRKDGRITAEEFAARSTALMAQYAEATDDPWEHHVRTALAVAH